MGMICWVFLTREDVELVGKVLRKYGSGICLGKWFAHYKPALYWVASRLFEPSPKRLRNNVLAKDEVESQKPHWLLMVFESLFFNI